MTNSNIRTGKIIECKVCYKGFYVKPSQIKRRKCCSIKCMGINAKGKPFDRVRRKKMSEGQLKGARRKNRRMIFINGKRELYSHFTWRTQKENLSFIPNSCEIHHVDGNYMNDSPNNLLLIPKGWHQSYHNYFNKARREGLLVSK